MKLRIKASVKRTSMMEEIDVNSPIEPGFYLLDCNSSGGWESICKISDPRTMSKDELRGLIDSVAMFIDKDFDEVNDRVWVYEATPNILAELQGMADEADEIRTWMDVQDYIGDLTGTLRATFDKTDLKKLLRKAR